MEREDHRLGIEVIALTMTNDAEIPAHNELSSTANCWDALLAGWWAGWGYLLRLNFRRF
jgi:hypothetical protein